MTDARLAELEGLHMAATRGPWRARLRLYEPGEPDRSPAFIKPVRGVDGPRGTVLPMTVEPEDADFIAEARNALPELVAELRRLRAALATAHGEGGAR